MKLKKLLKLIPDTFEVGLVDNDRKVLVIALHEKEDAVTHFAELAHLTEAHVLNMIVVAVHPRASALFVPDFVTAHNTKTAIMIEISDEAEKEK